MHFPNIQSDVLLQNTYLHLLNQQMTDNYNNLKLHHQNGKKNGRLLQDYNMLYLVLFFPLWLGDMPALLKGFLEQVARPGFAFMPQGDNPFAG